MKTKFTILFLLLLTLFIADIAFGNVSLSFSNIWSTITGNNQDPIYREIILNHRLPKAITAILTGAALSVAGVLMQTMFHNPLAGPDVLGVTSGASLGVALLTMGVSTLPVWMIADGGQVIAAIIGATVVLLLVIIASVRVPQTVSLLIIGMMFGYFASAIVSILQSASNPDTLKLFINWTFGNLSEVGWNQLTILGPIIGIGILMALLLQKQLNVLLLGKNYAEGLGVSVPNLRLYIILATAHLPPLRVPLPLSESPCLMWHVVFFIRPIIELFYRHPFYAVQPHCLYATLSHNFPGHKARYLSMP